MNATMTSDLNKTTYRRFIEEVFNQGQLDAIEQLVAPNYVQHNASPGTAPGRDGVKHIVSMFRGAFPDLKITIDDQVAEGDKVCSLVTTRGTHTGAIFGVAGTGKTVSMTGLTMVRLAGGRIVESWVNNDIVGLMNQIGPRPSTN